MNGYFFGFVFLWFRNFEGQDAVLEFRLDFVRVYLCVEAEGPGKITNNPFTLIIASIPYQKRIS
jgi:hypothetical protein